MHCSTQRIAQKGYNTTLQCPRPVISPRTCRASAARHQPSTKTQAGCLYWYGVTFAARVAGARCCHCARFGAMLVQGMASWHSEATARCCATCPTPLPPVEQPHVSTPPRQRSARAHLNHRLGRVGRRQLQRAHARQHIALLHAFHRSMCVRHIQRGRRARVRRAPTACCRRLCQRGRRLAPSDLALFPQHAQLGCQPRQQQRVGRRVSDAGGRRRRDVWRVRLCVGGGCARHGGCCACGACGGFGSTGLQRTAEPRAHPLFA